MEVKRLFDILDNYLEKHPNQTTAIAGKKNKTWKTYSIQKYSELTNTLSYGLISIGIKPGDRIGLVSHNRPEWNMLDFAIMQVGAICVPIYPTISQEDYKYILHHTEMKMIIFEGKSLSNKLTPLFKEFPLLTEIFTFDAQGESYRTFDDLIESGKENPQPELLNQIKNQIKSQDLATIIYTSGTTGNPKGVMLSHDNIVNNMKSVINIVNPKDERALSFLPLCHAYERLLVYLYQYMGVSVYYAENIGTIVEDIKEVNPNIMTCVPRLLEKIYNKLYVSGKKLPFLQKKIYYWAFNLANEYQLEGKSKCYHLKLQLAEKLIFHKWRTAIGGDFDVIVSGGSALQPHIGAFFSAIKMDVFEGYGLSETSPVIAVSTRTKRQFGTVGPALEGTEVKIGENNEILCRGHNVMLGYYKDPEMTANVIDKDGWFHTGDIGEITDKGLIKVTGRLKSLFKTSFGKYVNPEFVEKRFSQSTFIENIIVLGENKQFAAALIIPDFITLESWAKRNNITFESKEDLLQKPKVVSLFKKLVDKNNKYFGDYEKVRKYILLSDDWTVENGFLSPTLKLKRNFIQAHYQEIISKLF